MTDKSRVLSPEARLLATQRRARKRWLAKTRTAAGETQPASPTKIKVRPTGKTAAADAPSSGFTRTALDTSGRELARQSPTQRHGAEQEALALAHLENAGLQLLARNVASRVGELDLVMQDGDILVFVEVRARSSSRFGGAAASVTFAKQQRLTRAAQVFLKTAWRGPVPRCRFDVVAISPEGIAWLRDAFTPSYT
ncbi:YraN family protein [Pigmentiphaga aceris]|uniref:UPF0102 protein FXN63_23945 n=1 Tax=Pigmentiphaga aceris TaxID=1940612 RepID=A0A5C0B194_9BURK|nr:YraN family protein [Pigmentiphaga aceris]QEI08549.1 YraN family protein [Pigmentiphaga aceris]